MTGYVYGPLELDAAAGDSILVVQAERSHNTPGLAGSVEDIAGMEPAFAQAAAIGSQQATAAEGNSSLEAAVVPVVPEEATVLLPSAQSQSAAFAQVVELHFAAAGVS